MVGIGLGITCTEYSYFVRLISEHLVYNSQISQPLRPNPKSQQLDIALEVDPGTRGRGYTNESTMAG